MREGGSRACAGKGSRASSGHGLPGRSGEGGEAKARAETVRLERRSSWAMAKLHREGFKQRGVRRRRGVRLRLCPTPKPI